ncbi:MAG TPA: hypothetical protein DCE78_00365 [Bacteroidetes bacterium]|nr:hypothetical protein [Bacteroidota bacterium]
MLLFNVQTDTLTQAYSDKWDGPTQDEGAFIDFMTSNDMIFVVLGVSLIIWFVLLFFITRTEKKLAIIEASLKNLK